MPSTIVFDRGTKKARIEESNLDGRIGNGVVRLRLPGMKGRGYPDKRNESMSIPEVADQIYDNQMTDEQREIYNQCREDLREAFEEFCLDHWGQTYHWHTRKTTCPYCGQEPGERCVTESGDVTSHHKDRKEKGKEKKKEAEQRKQEINESLREVIDEKGRRLYELCEEVAQSYCDEKREKIVEDLQKEDVKVVLIRQSSGGFKVDEALNAPPYVIGQEIPEKDANQIFREGESQVYTKGGSRGRPVFPGGAGGRECLLDR